MNERSPLAGTVRKPSWLLGPAIVAIAVASLSIHVVMLQVLHVPYPAMTGVGRWGLVLVLLRVLALTVVYRLARPSLTRFPFAARIATIALLDMTVAGNVRSAIMEAVVTADFAFPAINLALNLARSLALATLIVGSQWIARPSWAIPIVAVVVTAIMTMAIDPISRAAVAPFAHLRRPEIYTQPYGVWVLSWSYAAFIETVVGALVIARLVAPRLSAGPMSAMLQFVVLILLLRGTLVMQLLFPWFMQPGVAAAALSTSQFFLQDVAMAALVWALWRSSLAGVRTRSP